MSFQMITSLGTTTCPYEGYYSHIRGSTRPPTLTSPSVGWGSTVQPLCDLYATAHRGRYRTRRSAGCMDEGPQLHRLNLLSCPSHWVIVGTSGKWIAQRKSYQQVGTEGLPRETFSACKVEANEIKSGILEAHVQIKESYDIGWRASAGSTSHLL